MLYLQLYVIHLPFLPYSSSRVSTCSFLAKSRLIQEIIQKDRMKVEKVGWKEIGLKDKKTIKSYAAWTRTTARQTTVFFIFIIFPERILDLS